MSYDPKSFAPLVFHTQRERFLQQQSTPTEFLEQCLANIEAREDEVQAWVVLNTDEARAAARASTQRYQEGRPLSAIDGMRSEEHTSELQSRGHLVCRLLL